MSAYYLEFKYLNVNSQNISWKGNCGDKHAPWDLVSYTKYRKSDFYKKKKILTIYFPTKYLLVHVSSKSNPSL